jgi:hypothetical protein
VKKPFWIKNDYVMRRKTVVITCNDGYELGDPLFLLNKKPSAFIPFDSATSRTYYYTFSLPFKQQRVTPPLDFRKKLAALISLNGNLKQHFGQ